VDFNDAQDSDFDNPKGPLVAAHLPGPESGDILMLVHKELT
jgi:hypothetical protein